MVLGAGNRCHDLDRFIFEDQALLSMVAAYFGLFRLRLGLQKPLGCGDREQVHDVCMS